jgi:D-3-phosphoglycerate dehydrogenase
MTSLRILNVEPDGYSTEARSILAEVGPIVDGPLSRPELLAKIADYEVLIVRLAHQFDREVIDAGKRLKVIVSTTTGLDHIDLGYAAQKGVHVLSLRGEIGFLRTVGATAEHTWALLLALLRRIPGSVASVKNGEWNRDRFRGQELEGKRLGIVGLGRIGRKVARYGQAFGMDVSAYDPSGSEWVEGVKRAFTLCELLCHSDVLTIHVPLSNETYGLISRQEVSLLPFGSVLVNTARGEVVDENALLEALQTGHLSGAALDVLCNERDDSLRLANPLLRHLGEDLNLIITPHIGGATYESMERTEVFMARKLAAFAHNL